MKFIATKELGRLAKWLRILGYDTTYFNQDNKASFLISALREDRVILTRNTRLTPSNGMRFLRIKSNFVSGQIKEVLSGLSLKPVEDCMFSRCVICNETLNSLPKEIAKDRVPQYVFNTQEVFLICLKCKRIFWQGTHWGNVRKTLEEIL